MSKKQKAAGKAKTKGKKADVSVKKQKTKSGSAAGKSSGKSQKKDQKKSGKTLKSIVTKAVKTVAKKALGPKSKAASSASSKKSGTVKKVIKAVKTLVAKKSSSPPSSKTTSKPASGKAAASSTKTQSSTKPASRNSKEPKGIKALKPKQELKKDPAKALKPAVAVPAKTVKAAIVPPAVKASKNGQAQKVQPAEKSKPSPAPAPKASEAADKAGRKLNDLFVKKPIERKPNDVLAITNTIPVKTKNEISPSKIASISYAITNPVRKTDSYSVKPEKEPQGKFEMEFVVHASAEMLYEFLSTPSGLSEWFCDDLNIRNGIYTFIWDDQLQQARLLKTIDQQLVRFQWVDKTDGSYFEFRIQRDDLTNDISLIITDFADTSSERESSKLLWNSQVEKLMHVIGSIF